MTVATPKDFVATPLADRSRVLVIGYGNTLRRDDGVGVVAAELLAADPRFAEGVAGAGLDVLTVHQLTPELALDMAAASLVILIDADAAVEPGTITVRAVDAAAPGSGADAPTGPGPSSHHVSAGLLLALADQLAGHRPEAFAVGIGVADLEAGEGLSAAVEEALPSVVDVVAALVTARRGD